MLKKIISKQALSDRAAMLKRNRFRPGFDGMSMSGAHSWININGERLCRELFSGDYTPMPAVGFRSAKHGGGFRLISRICAIDTVIQQVILSHLSADAETIFLENSFAYRPGRGVNSAVEQYIGFANRFRLVARFDLEGCFDNLDHGIMESTLHKFCDDEELIRLCMSFVKTPLYIDGEVTPTEKGLLQGMPLSPLFCNMYLHEADVFFHDRQVPFIRYADDIVVFGNSLEELEKFLGEVSLFFEEKLKLKLNRKKTKIDSCSRISFLGHRFTSDKKGVVAVSEDTGAKMSNRFWVSKKPFNNRKRVDLISDGILRQKNISLFFDTETVDTTVPLAGTDVINVYSDVIFDSGVLRTALKNGISINIFDRYGDCCGSFVPNTAFKAPRVTHEQLCAYYDETARLEIAREFVLASIHNTNLVIRYYNKQNPSDKFIVALNRIRTLKTQIKAENTYEKLLLLEAQARCAYYDCFDDFLRREDFRFEKRTRRPPKNEVNALISFGNTVLYNYIATEIQKSPLDVRIGFLHATGNRAKSLNLDFAEIFKPLIVDRTIFSLINKGELSAKHFTESSNGAFYLSPEGKRVFLRAFYNKLDTEITVKSATLTYRDIITEEVRKLVRHFRGSETYKAYRQVR